MFALLFWKCLWRLRQPRPPNAAARLAPQASASVLASAADIPRAISRWTSAALDNFPAALQPLGHRSSLDSVADLPTLPTPSAARARHHPAAGHTPNGSTHAESPHPR